MYYFSPANSLETNLSLLDKAQCNIFLKPEICTDMGRDIMRSRQMEYFCLPRLEDLTKVEQVALYSYTKTFEEGVNQFSAMTHSSGTTGPPKVLAIRQGIDCKVDSYQNIPSLGGAPIDLERFRNRRVFISFALSLNPGLVMSLCYAVFFEWVAVLIPSLPTVDARTAHGVHVHGNVQISVLPRPMLISLAKDDNLLHGIGNLEIVATGGSSVPGPIGDRLSTRTRLVIALGITETGLLPVEWIEAREDWNYFKFSKCFAHEMCHFCGNLYHLVLLNEERTFLRISSGVFASHPDLDRYPTRDLFTQHPQKKGLWQHRGRIDDMIAFSGGEMWNPTPVEKLAENHPGVRAALVLGGKNRGHACLLLEKDEEGVDEAEPDTCKGFQPSQNGIIDQLWPSIVESMREDSIPEYLLRREFLFFTSPGKPMARTGAKMTISRQVTSELYASELNKLYATAIQKR